MKAVRPWISLQGPWLQTWLLAFGMSASAFAQYEPPRCEIVPLADHQVSFQIDGRQKLIWHFDSKYPRPFFYPLNGPSGQPLTRMGHPGAQNHDHHRSIWFAHHKIDGIDFWSDNTQAKIVQTHWYRYRDGNEEAVMAAHLDWIDGDGVQRMQQDVVAALMPIETTAGVTEHALELQLTFTPGTGRERVVMEQTNFGVLAVRVAASLSGYFGGGRLTNDQGIEHETNLHERTAQWIDYSGPIAVPDQDTRKLIEEGITYFDHPSNPSYPTYWHVRQDGWMGAAPGMKSALEITNDQPLVLRYLLYAHSGPMQIDRAKQVQAAFHARPGFRIRAANKDEPHRQFEVERIR